MIRSHNLTNQELTNTILKDRPDHQTLSRVMVKLREKSWDFAPPEIIRPVAITNVYNIAIIARRLGMTWFEFRPEENLMRAEGNDHVLTSTLVRSMGIVIQYMHSGGKTETLSKKERYIPREEADLLGFGVLCESNLFQFHYLTEETKNLQSSKHRLKIGSIDEILLTMDTIGCEEEAIKKARDMHTVGKKPFGFSDIIPLVAPMMRYRGNSIIRLPVPADHCDGLTSYKEGI